MVVSQCVFPPMNCHRTPRPKFQQRDSGSPGSTGRSGRVTWRKRNVHRCDGDNKEMDITPHWWLDGWLLIGTTVVPTVSIGVSVPSGEPPNHDMLRSKELKPWLERCHLCLVTYSTKSIQHFGADPKKTSTSKPSGRCFHRRRRGEAKISSAKQSSGNHKGNGGTPKSSLLVGCSIVNHAFWGTPILGTPHNSTTVLRCWGQPLSCSALQMMGRRTVPASAGVKVG